MPAGLENLAVTIGLKKVSFHSNPKERQCQRMFKLRWFKPKWLSNHGRVLQHGKKLEDCVTCDYKTQTKFPYCHSHICSLSKPHSLQIQISDIWNWADQVYLLSLWKALVSMSIIHSDKVPRGMYYSLHCSRTRAFSISLDLKYVPLTHLLDKVTGLLPENPFRQSMWVTVWLWELYYYVLLGLFKSISRIHLVFPF